PIELVEAVREALAREAGELSPHRVAEVLQRQGRPVGAEVVRAVHEDLQRSAFGLGPLASLVADPSVTDILVNGAGRVWIDRGHGVESSPVTVATEAEVRRLAQRLASLGGRRLDDATPWCDVRLPDGT